MVSAEGGELRRSPQGISHNLDYLDAASLRTRYSAGANGNVPPHDLFLATQLSRNASRPVSFVSGSSHGGTMRGRQSASRRRRSRVRTIMLASKHFASADNLRFAFRQNEILSISPDR